jgi:hypothetical protein
LLQALDNQHNKQEVSIEQGCVRSLHTGKLLGSWAKVQLVVQLVGCNTSQQHHKKQELQALAAAYKKHGAACLWCPMCTGAAKLEEAGMLAPSQAHANVMRWLAAQCTQPFCAVHCAIPTIHGQHAGCSCHNRQVWQVLVACCTYIVSLDGRAGVQGVDVSLCARHELQVDGAKEGIDHCYYMHLDFPTHQVGWHFYHHVHAKAVIWAAVVGISASWLDLDMEAIHET